MKTFLAGIQQMQGTFGNSTKFGMAKDSYQKMQDCHRPAAKLQIHDRAALQQLSELQG
ncbi:hypothetical protein DSO57_1036318 [Entomophthora muscae]|uniref:Uncharacterized protein n=1 Tax=Entomophthora muscae TaxID=34485 RepID=A0ACC2RE00_9FUNG|nr:hypothetical protein DSO57_1036318 [Entomophthora muscae]